MSVVANRAGSNAVVTVTEGVQDILDQAGLSNAEKKLRCLQRCYASFGASIDAVQNTDAVLDQRVVQTQTQVAAVKAQRPSGNL